MRKIVVMLLALIIALGMSATIFAAETGDTELTASNTELDADDEEISEPDEEEPSDIDGEEISEPGENGSDLLPAVAPASVPGTNPDTGDSGMFLIAAAVGIVSLAVLAALSHKREN